LAISDQHHKRLAATRDELAAGHGDMVWSQPCDVTDEAQVAALVEGAAGHFGRIDVMINNAGLGGTASVLDMTDEQWSRVLDVTLTGTFRCTRAALRQLVAQGHGGAVVNTPRSWAGAPQPGQAHYAAAKAGVMALTRCAALDVAAHGIRVNAVAPSLAVHPFLSLVSSEDLLAELAAAEPFGRAAQPWEVANVIVFLAIDYASYMTGEVVSVSAQQPLEALDDRGGGHRPAGAHGDQRGARAASLELVQRGGEQPGTGAAHRMAEAIAPPLTFHPVRVGPVHRQPGQHDRRERLVDLEQVDVADGHTAATPAPARSPGPGRPRG